MSEKTNNKVKNNLPFHRSLAFRQARLTILIALILGLVFSFLQIFIDYLHQRDAIDNTLAHQAKTMSSPAADALWYLNGDLATGVIDGVFTVESVIEARIETASGYPLAVRWRNSQEYANQWLSEMLFGKERRVEKVLYYDPDNLEQRPVGRLIVVADPTVDGLGFISRAITTLISAVVKNVILAIILFVIFYWSTTRTLIDIVGFLQKIDPIKPVGKRTIGFDKHRHDELGLLSDSLNALIRSVGTYSRERDVLERALLETNRNLEHTVATRTEELEATVTKLKQQSGIVRLLGKVAELANVEPEPVTAMQEALPLLINSYGSVLGYAEVRGDWLTGKHTQGAWLSQPGQAIIELGLSDDGAASVPELWRYAEIARTQPQSSSVTVNDIKPVKIAGQPGEDAKTAQAVLIVPVLLNDSLVARMVLFFTSTQLLADDVNTVMRNIGEQLARVFERKQSRESLLELAQTDSLTGVLNRRAFEERVNDEFRLSIRHHRNLACVALDLDHFKQVNDTYGHAAGDQVLMQTTRVVQAQLRESDIFGRMGGEEFALVLPECSLSMAMEVAERVRKALAGHSIQFGGQEISITASIGVSIIAEADEDYKVALERADSALYKAKSSGRNCCWFQSPGGEPQALVV